jgi:uncharacterized protein (TIGR00295 family)
MAVPTREECYRILKEARVSPLVLEHLELVEALASAVAEVINGRRPGSVDIDLVTAGALLHDIGRSVTHAIQHAEIGVRMAEEMDLDPRVVEIIRRHVGGGLMPEEALSLDLPSWDGMPRTLEEKVVCHADTLMGARGRRSLEDTLEHIRGKDAPEYERRVEALHKELSELAGRDIDTIGPWPANL